MYALYRKLQLLNGMLNLFLLATRVELFLLRRANSSYGFSEDDQNRDNVLLFSQTNTRPFLSRTHQLTFTSPLNT